MLFDAGIPIPHLAKTFGVATRSIYRWIDLYETHGLVVAISMRKQGWPPSLDVEVRDAIAELLRDNCTLYLD